MKVKSELPPELPPDWAKKHGTAETHRGVYQVRGGFLHPQLCQPAMPQALLWDEVPRQGLPRIE
jgi:hypothetical protein